MTKHLALFGALALVAACDDLTPTDDVSGDVSGTDSGTDTGSDSGTDTSPIVTSGDVSCDDTSVTFLVTNSGIASDIIIFSQETGNVEPQYSDEHSDFIGYYTSAGEEWEKTLDIVADNAVADQSTIFSCDGHFDASNNVMTYAAIALDGNGDAVDCFAWGHDPQAMIDGTANRVNPPSVSLANCVF